MTNTTPSISPKGGIAKASTGMLWFDFAQHVTPSLAGYLNAACPILGIDYSFEVVVAIESVVGAFIVWFTPQHFLQAIVDIIEWARCAKKQICEACNQPLQTDKGDKI